MNLFTQVPFPDAKKMIDYQSRLVFIGSCFTEEIGRWLSDLKFTSHINPYGITYNPISMANQIKDSLEGRDLKRKDIQEKDGSFFHPDFHSSMNRSSIDDFQKNARESGEVLRKELKSADFLFLTFGTSIAFEWKKSNQVVNNCHRLPSGDFKKVMLSEKRMTEELVTAIEQIKAVNPKVGIVLTVSPIRHLRHGAVQNQRSKARLLKLCESLEAQFNSCTYLPIYELVMDELRDYRYYRQDDLIHLNEGGLEVIKDRFMTSMIDSASFPTIRKVEKWQRSITHRIQNEESEGAKKFKQQLIELTEGLNKELRGRFSEELTRLKSS
ncbi:GSCFA domain-containing protein [Cryomorphaceae bacterium 1068]|nr:GSCFA domain-containing protein [Cryomorphaceae bacterium 1068]